MMTKKVLSMSLVFGAGLASVAAAQEPSGVSVKGQSATITGCVVSGKDDSFVLTHVVETSGLGSPSTPTMEAMSGVQGGSQDVIYWLSSDSVKLIKEHVGEKVEVTGVVTNESTGTVRYSQDPGKSGPDNKIEVQARGKEASAKTDKPIKRPASTVKSDETQTLPVRRVKVATVKTLAPTCP